MCYMGLKGRKLEDWCMEAYSESFESARERFRREGLEELLNITKRRAKDGDEYAAAVLNRHGVKW